MTKLLFKELKGGWSFFVYLNIQINKREMRIFIEYVKYRNISIVDDYNIYYQKNGRGGTCFGIIVWILTKY